MQTNPTVEENTALSGQIVRRISPVGEEEVCDGKDISKTDKELKVSTPE